MDYVILGLRVLLFALSTFGYMSFLHRRTHLAVEFLPGLVFCGQICVLVLAGILNLLLPSVFCICALGVVCAALSLKYRGDYRDFLCPALVIFAAASAYFLVLLKGQVFDSYDNFSHWALVVKQMLLTDRFPTFKDSLILFQGYPLGASAFVYYVARIISPVSEGCQMFAQTMLTMSMILPLFYKIKKSKTAQILLLLGSLIFFLSYNNKPTTLYVDTLLPLTGAFAFILLEEELSGSPDGRNEGDLTAWLSVLPAVAVVTIKNSSILFWALAAVRAAIYLIKHRKSIVKSVVYPLASVIAVPLCYLILWNRHVNYVFKSSDSSPHSMSISNYISNFQDKLDGSIPEIASAFVQKLSAGRGLLILLALILLITAAAKLLRLQSPHLIRTAAFVTAVFAVYQAGNFLMYIFSMPEGEALVMAGYGRYYKTIIIFCLAYALYKISEWLSQHNLPLTLGCTAVFFAAFWTLGASLDILKRQETNSRRTELETLMNEYSMELYQDYLIFIPEDDTYYTYHLARYLFYTSTVDVHVITDADECAKVVETAVELGYEYLINLDPDNTVITDYCAEVYGVGADVQVIRIDGEDAS